VWTETSSEHFAARHQAADADDAAGVLELLEATRTRLARAFALVPTAVDVVLHNSEWQLLLARPGLAVARVVAAPAARRYVAGSWGAQTLHVLAPRRLEARASAVPGSRELALLAPAALYARAVVGMASPVLAPPWRPRTAAGAVRRAWLAWGAAAYFSGQTRHSRPAIARRLHEGGAPSFPPGFRDARLLGGTVVELVASEQGEDAVVALVSGDLPLEQAFDRPLREVEARWRSGLAG
jgi:hypothetical protein